MEEGRLRKGAYIVILALGAGALAFLFFKYLFLALLPFLIAWGVAFATRPAAAAISRRVRIPTRVIRAVLAVLISVAFIGLICLLGWAIASELWRLLSGLGEGNALRDIVDKLTAPGIFGEFFESFGDRIADVFYELLVSLASSLGAAVTSWLGAVPKIFLFILIAVIASVYFALDLERINAAVLRLAPRAVHKWLSELRRGFFTVGMRYLRSYLLLMLMTFVIMLVGLTVLGRPYAILLSFVIAALDVLPVLGVGTVLIPWGIYELAVGDSGVGVGLLVLFCVYELIRQLAEPRIVGKQLGVHPLLTLLLIYVGYTLFGFVGILLMPCAVVLINITAGKNNSSEVKERSVAEHNGT